MIGCGTYNLHNVETIVYEAVKIGYRIIDTAELYHNSNEVYRGIKRALDENICEREELTIISKIKDKDLIRSNIENALIKIKEELKYVDVILLHNPVTNYLECWNILCNIYQKYDIKYIGVSNFNISQLESLIFESLEKPYLNQSECSIYHQEKELREYCSINGILFQAHSGYYDENSLIWLSQNKINCLVGTNSTGHLIDNYNLYISNLQNTNRVSTNIVRRKFKNKWTDKNEKK